MTGTWRDTLFVWQGSANAVDVQEGSSPPTKNKNNGIKQGALKWKGTWVGCNDCPDSRTAVTPDSVSFQQSDMEFEVETTSTNKDDNDDDDDLLHLFDMTAGSGWDLGGEGDEEKERHQDWKQIIAMKKTVANSLLDATKTTAGGIKSSNEDDTTHLVVATGNNNFGDFISAGYLKKTTTTETAGAAALPVNDDDDDPNSSASNKSNNSNNSNNNLLLFQLTLGRRYLDTGDIRSKWTAQELYQKIESEMRNDTEKKTPPPSETTTTTTTTSVPPPPWRRTSLLHAKKMTAAGGGAAAGRKRKRRKR